VSRTTSQPVNDACRVRHAGTGTAVVSWIRTLHGVAGMALTWRAKAALLKGATLALLGLYVLGITVWGLWHGKVPEAHVMGIVGIAALIANGAVALMLYRFRSGDANMRSVWICSRNDAIGNIAVVFAAAGVFRTGTAWPDLIVAGIMAALGISGGVQIVTAARRELASPEAQDYSRITA
jgi:Co/Zn/Cd efflux system component